MLGHICPSNAPFILKFFLAGNLWVGLFFFYSGYGLQYSLDGNKNYINKGFIKLRLKKVYIPFLFAETIFTIVLIMKGEINCDLISFIGYCSGVKLANSVLWYVIEILIMYFLFWCINRYTPTFQWLWIVAYLLFLGVAVACDVGTWWYISTSCFLLGLYHKDIYKFFDKHSFRYLKIVTCVLFAVIYSTDKFYTFNIISSKVLPQNYVITALDMILAPLFIFVCMIISESLDIRNKILINVGSMSYEIYLYHMLIKRIFENIYGDTYISVLVISIITIIVGEVMLLSRKKALLLRKS